MAALIPKKFFLTKGTGIHKKELRAFENALRDAGVQMCNLVKVSSIIAPGCEMISREEGIKLLKPGEMTFAVIAQSRTNEPGQTIGAAIGMAQPKDETIHGYLTEVEEAVGRTEKDLFKDAVEMAIENLVTEWGHTNFDGESVYKQGKKNYELYGKDVAVDGIALTAEGAEDNQYTVVFVAAVFIY